MLVLLETAMEKLGGGRMADRGWDAGGDGFWTGRMLGVDRGVVRVGGRRMARR